MESHAERPRAYMPPLHPPSFEYGERVDEHPGCPFGLMIAAMSRQHRASAVKELSLETGRESGAQEYFVGGSINSRRRNECGARSGRRFIVFQFQDRE